MKEYMNSNTNTHDATSIQAPAKAKQIKLGIDVHKSQYRVVRQIDGANPQPAQRFTPKLFLAWAARQFEQAEEVFSCYEAGPFGFGLHRELEKIGVRNYVVQPQVWDELGKGVKTDKTDALALVRRLAMYVGGNLHAFSVVSVPTPEQELARSLSRLREQFQKDKSSTIARGRSLMLYYAVVADGRWWGPTKIGALLEQLPEQVREMVGRIRDAVVALEKQVQELTEKIKAQAGPQPHGVGALSSQILQREVLDCNRFKNRRQVASYTGLCPGVRASGSRCRNGSITKHGNPRVRNALVEMAWRMVRFQSGYGPVKKWLPILASTKAAGGAKKKAIIALARHLAVDLWRLNTGRCTAEQLGLC
jgi:transposase